jgi:predicted ribosomally synthesized peptide with nif11-like leader
MSEQAARALIERMKHDPEFRDRVLAAAHPEERLALLRAEGHDCSAAEIAHLAGALSDTALANVAAGVLDGCPRDGWR